MFVENGFGQKRGHLGFVIGMSDNHQNIGLEALVGRKLRRSLGNLSGMARDTESCQNENQTQRKHVGDCGTSAASTSARLCAVRTSPALQPRPAARRKSYPPLIQCFSALDNFD